MEPESEQAAVFPLETLCPFKAKRLNRWLPASSEEAWEKEQRSNSSVYGNKGEPQKTLCQLSQP